jgi:dihydrolipoamide dehydrogenase
MDKTCDLAVLGGGPGGYVAAIRAAQLGLNVILVEREALGGVCMNWGCIPTKYLLGQTKQLDDIKKSRNIIGPVSELRCDWDQVQAEKEKIVKRLVKGVEFLLDRNSIQVIKGTARFHGKENIEIEQGEGRMKLAADKVILALGSRPAGLPFLQPNGKEVITSREALEMRPAPEEMIVIGAGAVGLEMASIFTRLGTDVTVLELMPGILPGADEDMSARLEQLLSRQGLKIHTRMDIQNAQVAEGNVCLKGVDQKNQQPFSFESGKILLAVGRRPNSEGLGEEPSRLELDKAGYVQVDEKLQTGIPGVYAIGDLIGGMLLAHKASHEGIIAAENASGLDRQMTYEAMPLAVFTEPEFASVGLTEQGARDRGIDLKTGTFSLQASGRAVTMGRTDGFVKVLADAGGRIRGAHILSAGASEMIPELTLAIGKKMTLEDVSQTVHIHPTLSEALMEAALKAQNRAIHILNE